VLSEAGAGKTAEIRLAAQALRTQGKQAFFLRLEEVAEDLNLAFEVGDPDDFQAWLASAEEGWLLLDSVDEARLRHPGDFERAIRRMASRLGGARERAHVLITSRIPAWRPRTDLEFCLRHLPVPGAARQRIVTEEGLADASDGAVVTKRVVDEVPQYMVVTLDDLDRDRVGIFARARGVLDLGGFTDAIDRADAWTHTARPQDLDDLVSFWLDTGRIGGRLELVRDGIGRRLKERDQKRAESRPLAHDRVEIAARLIAAACVLTREATIQVPDGVGERKGLSLADLLPDWDERDQAALLLRPIFDEATYGAVRFYHRSVREYLAAEWFAGLLAQGASRRRIEALFFREQYGLVVVTPALRPVLPWLALLDERILDRLRVIAPEVLFEGGDPGRLPQLVRSTLLRDVCRGLADTTVQRTMTDYAAVQRFAAPDLVDDIRELLAQHEDSDEVTAFLVRMVWIGQLAGLLPEARALALRPTASTYARVAAVRAVKAVGTPGDLEEIRNRVAGEGEEIERDLLAELVATMEPSPQHLPWLVGAARRAGAHPRAAVDRLADAVTTFAKTCPLELLGPLLVELNRLLDERPHVDGRHLPVSLNLHWLLPAAAKAVERLVTARAPDALAPASLAVMHKIGRAHRRATGLSDVETTLNELVPGWDEANRASFWHEVASSRMELLERSGKRLTELWQVAQYRCSWKLGGGDFDYFIDQIGERDLRDDRMVALSTAFAIYRASSTPTGWGDRLGAAVEGDAELAAKLDAFRSPPPDNSDTRKWRQEEARMQRRSARDRVEHEQNKESWCRAIQANIERLRFSGLINPPGVSHHQWYLTERMRENSSLAERWTEGNLTLNRETGPAMARVYRRADALNGGCRMRKSHYTEEQIAFALKQAELGTAVAEVCRKMGISEATFFRWKQKYGGLGPSELRRLKQLEEENTKLKRLVADLSLDKAMLQDVLAKKV